MRNYRQSRQFTIDVNASTEDINKIHEKLIAYNREHTNSEYDKPGIQINLVLKDLDNKVFGGVIVSTMLNVMHLEVLWVAENYRKQGFGRELVLAAERIGSEMGCISSLVCPLSFQSPEFFQKLGYQIFGYSDMYPDAVREYYLIKKYATNQ